LLHTLSPFPKSDIEQYAQKPKKLAFRFFPLKNEKNLEISKLFSKKVLQFWKRCDTISWYMDESRAHPLRRRFSSIISSKF
jgi:hypothetical protein